MNISGWYITGKNEAGTNVTLYAFPEGTTLQPGEYIVIYPSGGLSNGANAITLYNSSRRVQDSVTYRGLGSSAGVARVYNGDGTYSNQWKSETEAQSTPGEPPVPELHLGGVLISLLLPVVSSLMMARRRDSAAPGNQKNNRKSHQKD